MPDAIEYLGLSQTANTHFRIDGKAVSSSTVFRWMTKGVRHNGHTICLRHTFIGRRIVTTSEWVKQFLNEIEQAARIVTPAAPISVFAPNRSSSRKRRTEAQRRAALRKAESELIDAGM